MPETTVEIFSDGACSGNPGPGGYGAILRWNGKEKELSGGDASTTNNRIICVHLYLFHGVLLIE